MTGQAPPCRAVCCLHGVYMRHNCDDCRAELAPLDPYTGQAAQRRKEGQR